MTADAPAPDPAAASTPQQSAIEVVLWAAAVAAATFFILEVPHDFARATPIWIANALAVVWLLRSPRARWPAWIGAAWAASFAGMMAGGDDLAMGLAMATFNTLEVVICAFGLRWATPQGFDPGRIVDLAKGAGVAVVSANVSAALASIYLAAARDRPALGYFPGWMLSDVLGLMILTPCLVVLVDWRRYKRAARLTGRGLAVITLAVVTQALVFAETRYPLLFLAPLAPLVAALSVEMVGAACVVLGTAVVAVGFTFAGLGPLADSGASWTERLVPLQLFLAISTALTLHVAAMRRQRRVAAAQLSRALAEAEQAARVKGEFLANMSHEIRTPLTSILGFASLLSGRELDPEARRYADRVLGASRNLLALVNDVLDFSKLEAGRLEIKPQPGDPAQCGRDVVELFSAQAAQKGLAVDFAAGPAPPCLSADFDRVRQVLMNLVGNAVKFTPEGGVTVVSAYDPAAERLSYRVADTGPGVEPAARDKLFKRFSQVDAEVNRAHGGSGLGLAISKGLVEAMGGRIGVDSAPGQGSIFWFEIPAPPVESAAEATADTVDLDALVDLKVLLVDDNQANRELIRSLLAPLGVALTTADGGEAGLALARMQAFQLILMDLRMPGVDGWTAARAIRDEPGLNQSTPMLAFSADITADDANALSVFEGVVRKPIEMAELLLAISQWTRPQDAAPARPRPAAARTRSSARD